MTLGNSAEPQLSKAKTLAEKRRKLQEDMKKYGVAAIERYHKILGLTQKRRFQKGNPKKLSPKRLSREMRQVTKRRHELKKAPYFSGIYWDAYELYTGTYHNPMI